MIYSWKFDKLYPVDANVAGEELQRIYAEHGKVEPEDVVEESKPYDAPLHNCFEWNNDVAADKYRIEQARNIIRSIRVEVTTETGHDVEIRAFESVRTEYHPIQVIRQNADMMEELRASARSAMIAFKTKFQTLGELQGVIQAMDEALERWAV